MKNCIKFLLAVFAFSPLWSAVAAPISQTAGSNLTQYNGASGSIAGNQWNTMTNQRGSAPTAKADYGNCGALVLRCAKPKCSGGGCSTMDVAKSIALGCVNSNSTCKQHGDGLADFVAGQLVSSSQATMAQQQAAAQSAAAEQSAAQISQMQQQMQMQMQQMQEQNNAQLASLQNALEESQRAAAEAQAAAVQQAQAAAPDVNTGLTAVQTAAVKSGVSEDTIARATITGQIMSSMDGVDSSLANLKSTMREAFRYAGCNEVNGDNCTGPKRVKKFKELAMKFFEPYDALVDNLDDALVRAQSVGVDMTDIYMMLNGSCNRWGQYLCQGNEPIEVKDAQGNKTTTYGYVTHYYVEGTTCKGGKSVKGGVVKGGFECSDSMAIPPEADTRCVLNKEIGDEEVKQAWLDPDTGDGGAVIRIGCASSALQGSILGRRRAGGKKGGVSIDVLERLIVQDAPNSFKKKPDNVTPDVDGEILKYCAVPSGADAKLVSATVSKSLDKKICCQTPSVTDSCNSDCEENEDDVAYVKPIYALCSVHAYNANQIKNSDNSSEQEEVKRIIGLKSTVISQQMYKQYTMVESMIKRLKIMLEKATLKASLQIAGGTSDDDEDDGGMESEFTDCRKGDDSEVLNCLRDNYTKYQSYVNKGNAKRSVTKQMSDDMTVLSIYLDDPTKVSTSKCSERMTGKAALTACNNELAKGINQLNKQIQKASKSSSGGFRLVAD